MSSRSDVYTTYQLVLAASDVGNIHVVGRRRKIFVLLVREDVEGDKVDLGVTVLASLGGRHVDNLARATLDHDETVLAQGRALHGVRQRRTGVDRVEGHLMLFYHLLAKEPSHIGLRAK